MSRVFISHAGDDKPVIDTFVDTIIKLGCEVPRDELFYSSGPDTGVPSGSDLNAYVRAKLSEDGLVVTLVTPTFLTRPFCLAELGAAWSRTDNLFPLLAPGLSRDELDGVLDGMAVREWDDDAALDELHERVSKVLGSASAAPTWGANKRKWLERQQGLSVATPSPRPVATSPRLAAAPLVPKTGTKQWGQLFDSFVDAAFYTADDSVARDEIVRHARGQTLLPSRYQYVSDAGADNWIRLCRDPMYRHHRKTVDFWTRGTGRAMATAIRSALGTDDFDYVSLGPGDGKKDAALISYWLGMGVDLFYYPYDVSLPLISRAYHRVRTQAPRSRTDQLHIKAVLGDFNQIDTLSEVFTHRTMPNVVALLGNSLGNLELELEFLAQLHDQMSSEDLLVLEVRVRSEDGNGPVEFATPQSMRFDFGPLEHYFGLEFREEQMRHSSERNMSSIDDTTTTVISCKEVVLDGRGPYDVKLSYVHEYSADAFKDALDDLGFDLVDVPGPRTDAGFLVCVLRVR